MAVTYLLEVFLGGSLGLFREAPEFVPFELQSRHVFLHSAPELQVLLALPHQFDQAFERGLIVARVGQLAHLQAPADERASGEGALLLKEGFLVEMREGGEAGVVESVRFVDLGEVVGEEGVVHRFELIVIIWGRSVEHLLAASRSVLGQQFQFLLLDCSLDVVVGDLVGAD